MRVTRQLWCKGPSRRTTCVMSGVLNVISYHSGVSPNAGTFLYPERTFVGTLSRSARVNFTVPCSCSFW
jgi:hypothetical protein